MLQIPDAIWLMYQGTVIIQNTFFSKISFVNTVFAKLY